VTGREWNAASYDRISGPQAHWGAGVVDRLELAGTETVLDAGCGSGRVTELLLARLPGGHVAALDASEAMIEAARERLAAHGSRVSFVQADLLDLTPELHDALFDRLASVLRPGGQLVVQCGGAGNVATLTDTVARLGLEPVAEWCFAGVEDTIARLDAAGFDTATADVWLNEEPTAFEPGAPFEEFLETVCLRQRLAELPAAERAPFIRRIAAAMPSPALDYVRLNVVARRAVI
jgi:trans-aconitate 2-methyltransferase